MSLLLSYIYIDDVHLEGCMCGHANYGSEETQLLHIPRIYILFFLWFNRYNLSMFNTSKYIDMHSGTKEQGCCLLNGTVERIKY
jgi:hypothetical protein